MKTVLLRWRAEYNLRAASGDFSKPVQKAWAQGIALALGAEWKKPAVKIYETIALGMHI